MRYIKKEDIKMGQRLAKPIFNRDGVLLYSRGTTINDSVMYHINEMNTYGFYILDAAEPLPVITDEELEFERFQTAACITLELELKAIMNGNTSQDIDKLASDIVNNYGSLTKRITFIQNIRNNDDNVYKHCLNVAMLCAMISGKMGMDRKEQYNLVLAAFYHDIGKLLAPPDIINKPTKLTVEEMSIVRRAELEGFDVVKNSFQLSAGIKRYISQLRIELINKIPGNAPQAQTLLPGTKILQIADMYDILTAMRVYKDPTSEYEAVTFLQSREDLYDEAIVNALINSINILPPGCCVELTNGEKGLVLTESPYYPLRPTVLGFNTNHMYDLSQKKIYDTIKIKSVLKTLDNRFIMKPND